ncbi:kinase-like domain-containing protein [Mycena albidolilacea]|uniref:Kinase-like domain-containing protein n=1 Tax=Mycena albidolilacea TaxID=1033008 RepID=A0AAD7EWK2_9AGAR|nr:kinase-like domain-containing protein [Mycena albidolilacea]
MSNSGTDMSDSDEEFDGFVFPGLGRARAFGSPPRYRILNKLRHGACSTVWLTRDRVAKISVALKIVAAEKTSDSRELSILQCLKTPGAEAHTLHITELVHSLDFFRYSKFTPKITHQVVHQAIKGLELIDSRGIAHGDLHPGNFGLAILEATELSELDIWENTTAPSLRAIGTFFSTQREFVNRPPSLRILDFGNGAEEFLCYSNPVQHWAQPSCRTAYIVNETPPPRANTPIEYAAPEIAFVQIALNDPDAPWDQRSDIWALFIYGLVNSTDLFSPFMSGPVLHDMMYYCGEIPDRWREYLIQERKREELLVRRGVEDLPGLIRLILLRRMMKLDPTAAELLSDPYFDGL